MLTLDSIRDIKIYQSKKGYRFSVDSLILFSFIKLTHVKKIADLGAGSGIIGLLLAKKYSEAEVYLVEIQKGLYKNCEKNIKINGLSERVHAINEDIKNLASGEAIKGLEGNSFDLVVSNPPFRRPRTGKISPEDERALARHELMLEFKDLVKASHRLLKTGGRLCIIHLPERMVEIFQNLKETGLEPKRLRFVHSKDRESAKLLLVEAAKARRPGLIVEEPFIVYNEDGTYTEEMASIYRTG